VVPECFDSSDQYAAWIGAARLSGINDHDGYCTDCLPSYKERMMVEGRCGHPGVTFEFYVTELDDMEIEGRRP